MNNQLTKESHNNLIKESILLQIDYQLNLLRDFLYDEQTTSHIYQQLIGTIISEAHRFALNERFIFQWIDDKENKK